MTILRHTESEWLLLASFFTIAVAMKFILSVATVLFLQVSSAQTFLIQPFLQNADPDAVTITWESSSAAVGTVEWGLSIELGQTTTAQSQTGSGASQIFHARLTGLAPDTRYFYRATIGAAVSQTFDFVTPPAQDSEKSFSFIAMSDMQRDAARPNVFRDMCNEGVIGFVGQTGTPDIAGRLAFAMITGDLVDYGPDYQQWKNTYFNPSENLFRHIPMYPVLGNHEANSPNYFKYFQLPTNGTSGYEEHWWYKDYANVRIIGLDSNTGYLIPAQLSWLENVLNDACSNEHIDFVFAQIHHPFHSELWIAGNLAYTGQVIQKLESFSLACGKPSVHFYGHTHGYSRGQSLNASHVMVNVATAGGNIDYWNEYAQNDYPEHVISQDEYGFAWIDVQAGSNPAFTIRRISRGNESVFMDNVLRDSFTIRRYNAPPATPTGVFPTEGLAVSPGCVLELSATPYSDPDGDLHGASQWQISTTPDFANPTIDRWKQYTNWYNNVDLQANDDLTDELIENLAPNTIYYWRVRYRDRGLVWSDWSEPISFQTGTLSVSNNLLTNGGAENSTTGWTEVAGSFESILSGECAGNNAYAGSRLFAVGGVCEEHPYGEGIQDVSVETFASAIQNGTAVARFGGRLSDYQGTDLPQFRLRFLTAAGTVFDSTQVYGSQSGVWELVSASATIPQNCSHIRFVLMGTRQAGLDNDSYFDEMFLQIDTVGCNGIISELTEIQSNTNLFRVFPNPSSSEISIEAKLWQEGTNYVISDAAGRMCLSGQMIFPRQTVDVSSLSKGLYFIQLSGKTGGTLKFVKQ